MHFFNYSLNTKQDLRKISKFRIFGRIRCGRVKDPTGKVRKSYTKLKNELAI